MDRNLSDTILELSKRSTRVTIVDPQRDFTLQYNGSLGVLGTESDPGTYLDHHTEIKTLIIYGLATDY